MHPHLPPQPHSVDIDSETVLLEGAWRSREELVQEIRAMLDAGNYGIVRQSAALEALAEAMDDMRRLEFRTTSSLAEDLFAAAAKEGRTPDALVRDAVARYLATAGSGDDAILRAVPEPEGRRETHPELRAVDGLIRAGRVWGADLGGTWAGEIPQVLGEPSGSARGAGGVILDAALQAAVEAGESVALSSQLVTEPVSPEEAARSTPLEMTPKRSDSEPRDRRWFDGP